LRTLRDKVILTTLCSIFVMMFLSFIALGNMSNVANSACEEDYAIEGPEYVKCVNETELKNIQGSEDNLFDQERDRMLGKIIIWAMVEFIGMILIMFISISLIEKYFDKEEDNGKNTNKRDRGSSACLP